jgi:hypothetical protein
MDERKGEKELGNFCSEHENLSSEWYRVDGDYEDIEVETHEKIGKQKNISKVEQILVTLRGN